MKLLVTPRLLMRPFTESDLEDLTALFADPAVMQYIGPPNTLTPAKAADRLHEMMAEFEAEGFGMLAVIERREKRFIGRCGLMRLEGGDEIELDFIFSKHAWGKGYATEAAKEVLRYAFNVLKLNRVVGVTHPNNLPSQRVLEKLGMQHTGRKQSHGMESLKYVIENKVTKPLNYTSRLSSLAYL
jgi:[ribosomal protein S5]-alanine N-acetyltransferase